MDVAEIEPVTANEIADAKRYLRGQRVSRVLLLGLALVAVAFALTKMGAVTLAEETRLMVMDDGSLSVTRAALLRGEIPNNANATTLESTTFYVVESSAGVHAFSVRDGVVTGPFPLGSH